MRWFEDPKNGALIHGITGVASAVLIVAIEQMLTLLRGPDPPVTLSPTSLLIVSTIAQAAVSWLRNRAPF